MITTQVRAPMPNWNDVLNEISQTQPTERESQFDIVRRSYLSKLEGHTGRNVICYYSGFLSHPRVFGSEINDDDKNGFMLCCHKIDRSKGLDLILHTPGGNLYATDSIIHYLYQMFGGDIRAIVPQIAMSAGTMIAASCKSIVMGKHSNLGPVDPQINGHPAYAIQEQFKRAYTDIKASPSAAPIWAPMLAQLGVSFVQQCDWAIQYSQKFVAENLEHNMFKGLSDAKERSETISEKLSDLSENKSHEKRFYFQDCIDMGLSIEMLEENEEFQDLVLTIHHCFMHAINVAGVIKIIENGLGHASVKNIPVRQQGGLTIGFGSPPA